MAKRGGQVMMKPLQAVNIAELAAEYASPLGRDLFWRQCDFKPLLKDVWPVINVVEESKLSLNDDENLENAVVFINGRYSAEHSSKEINVVEVDANELTIEESKEPRHFFRLLNQKSTVPNYKITLSAQNAHQAVKIYQMCNVNQTVMIPLRLNIQVQSCFKGIVEFHYHHTTKESIWLNQSVDYQCEDYSELTVLELYDESSKLSVTHSSQVHLQEKSLFRQFVANKHFNFLYYQQDVYLNKLSSQWNISGFYILNEKQRAHYRLKAHHLNKKTQSKQFMRGLLSDHSWALFDSSAIVVKGAAGSESSQMNNNLLLGDKAKIQSFPILEIDEDDVVCSHGSTTGAFDEAMLFYLQSRGLSVAKSFSLMKRAFISEVIQKFDVENSVPHLQAYLNHKA